MSKENLKFFKDKEFKEIMLTYLRVYITNIAIAIKNEDYSYKEILKSNELLNNGTITKAVYRNEISSLVDRIDLKPVKDKFKCPYCHKKLVFGDNARVVLFLDDDEIIDKCKIKAEEYYGLNIIVKSPHIACRAKFVISCNSKKPTYCNDKLQPFYGHYISNSQGTFNNLYDKPHCLGDILNNPQKYENI